MSKPIILAVDDDREVLQAVTHDIRSGFGESFRVIRTDSGERALEVLRKAKLANDNVALLLVDQRMPAMTGVELLGEARPIYPEAKRVLLTAYADTDAAISAINDIRLDYYLMKPWDPPEERLFPVLDDLLDDWLARHRPVFEGVRVIGHRWSPESHAVRDFLARNQVPFRWLDLASDPAAQELLDLTEVESSKYPIVVFADGSVLEQPPTSAIAEKLGLRGRAEVPLYDVAIVGAGPAGLAAAVYASSEGLRTILVEREAAGGQAGMSSLIENYLGFPSGLSGADLARRAMDQARRFHTELLLTHEAVALRDHDGVLGVTLDDGSELRAHSVIVATGVTYRTLDVPGSDRLAGRGVYYGAATTEAASIRDEDVLVVGGANSAGQAAIYFSDFARSVTMLVRGDALSRGMSHYLVERIESTPNIRVRCNTRVEELAGVDQLETVMVRDTTTGACEALPASALFIFIGAVPRTAWLEGTLARDDHGFLLTGPDAARDGTCIRWSFDRDPFLLESNIPGVFVAGDVRHGAGKRVATAVGEGAMAVMSIWQHRVRCGL